MERNFYCFPCDAPFENRVEHLKFIKKDTWKELQVDKIEQINEIEPILPVEDEQIGVSK